MPCLVPGPGPFTRDFSNFVDLPSQRFQAESFKWFIRGPSFLAVVWFGSSPTPCPLSNFLSLPVWRERRWGRSQIIRLRESLVPYKSFNILWWFQATKPPASLLDTHPECAVGKLPSNSVNLSFFLNVTELTSVWGILSLVSEYLCTRCMVVEVSVLVLKVSKFLSVKHERTVKKS